MPKEVMEAMHEASRNYIPLRELHKAAGEYIAERLGVDAACLSSGAAAGMALAAAACMAGNDPAYRAQLPDTQGLKNKIVTFRSMRSNYDQGFRIAGATYVEIGMPKKVEAWDLKHALTDSTVAAVGYIVEHEHPGMLPLPTVIEIAHDMDVPVIVNAAAEIPPVENLWAFAHLGADLTIFSGGKDIRGPQSTGLIVGRKDLIDACSFHSCPNHSIGRSMKVGKEEIMKFLTALDLYLEQDFNKEMAEWEAQVTHVVDALSDIEGVTAKRVFPGMPGIQPIWIPRVYIDWTPSVTDRKPEELQAKLLNGDPRVAVGTSISGLVVNPQMLDSGLESIVADCIKRVLKED